LYKYEARYLLVDMDSVQLLEDTMRIESHNSIEEIRSFLIEEIDGARIHETGCIHAERTGMGEGPRVILNTHMDVVSPHIDFRRTDDTVKGRGACDAKGCLAPMVTAFSQCSPRQGSLLLVVSPDEETTQRGLYEYLSEGIEGDIAVVGEPTGLDVCPTARGHYDFQIEIHGQAAHGATPDSGLNATSCAAEAIRRIEDIKQLTDAELGSNSFTPTIIQGGNRPNQVPEYAFLVIDYRTLPTESREDAIETLKETLNGLDCDFDIDRYEKGSALASFRTDVEESIAVHLQDSIEETTGQPPGIRPFDAATEAAFFAPHMPVVVFGPGHISDDEGPVAHSEREYVSVQEVRGATESLSLFLEDVLG
jgi:acetylornithine deacetylase